MIYNIFTDGATSKNGQDGAKGGWAFSIYNENGEWLIDGAGKEYNTTNNRMEMTAIIEGLFQIQPILKKEDQVVVYSDSAYCVNAVKQCWYKNWQKNGWLNSKKEEVKNKDLWELLIPYFEKENYFFEKVKGHNGITENEKVDKLAKKAIKDLT